LLFARSVVCARMRMNDSSALRCATATWINTRADRIGWRSGWRKEKGRMKERLNSGLKILGLPRGDWDLRFTTQVEWVWGTGRHNGTMGKRNKENHKSEATSFTLLQKYHTSNIRTSPACCCTREGKNPKRRNYSDT
jgi:hypothetical protein